MNPRKELLLIHAKRTSAVLKWRMDNELWYGDADAYPYPGHPEELLLPIEKFAKESTEQAGKFLDDYRTKFLKEHGLL